MKSKNKNITLTYKESNKNFKIINYLVQYNNYCGGVFASNNKDGIIFSVYSLQLYNTELSGEDINVSLHGKREKKGNTITYSLDYYDNLTLGMEKIKGKELYDHSTIKYTLDNIDLDLFIKEAERIIKRERNWEGDFLFIKLEEDEIKDFYMNEINHNEDLCIYKIINHFYGNKKIFDCRYNKLPTLDLTDCELEKLPKCIKNLDEVENLIISNNYLQDGIEEILQLKNLKKIELFNNMISDLPKGIGHLECLEELIIEEKFIHSIPEGFGELKNLKRLTIKNTSINKIPNCICNLTNLEELIITGNCNLEKIPNYISQLQNLTYLYLFNNNIELLPDELGELDNLRVLKVSRNKLYYLPKTISMLSNLEKIDASYNRLEYLENDIFDIENLNELNIKGNQNIDVDEFYKIILTKKMNDKINLIN